MDLAPQVAVLYATIVVVNIIWWMVMMAAIGFGAIHMTHCPVQPNIPIYLTVMGASSILSIVAIYLSKATKSSTVTKLSAAFMTVLLIFNSAWLVAGSFWVYSVYPPNYSGPDNYCHKSTYLFAFSVTTLMWIILGPIFICCCCGLLTCFSTASARHNLIPSRNFSFYGATQDFRTHVVDHE